MIRLFIYDGGGGGGMSVSWEEEAVPDLDLFLLRSGFE